MKQLVDDLMTVLMAEATELTALIPLLEQEEKALLRGDAATVADLTTRKEAVVRELRRLEASRRGVLTSLGASLGLAPERLTLSEVLRAVPSSASRLSAMRTDLRTMLSSLATRHRRNGLLVEHSLRYASGLLATLRGALNPTPTYAATGRAGQGISTLGVLDRRA
jgi:flagellar biosynthesis/type III secretory pathway chaperone